MFFMRLVTISFLMIFIFLSIGYSFSYIDSEQSYVFEETEARLSDDIIFSGSKFYLDYTVSGSLIGISQKTIVNGLVKGDLYLAGSTLIINGNIEGDCLLLGQYVYINGNISGDVRVYSQELLISEKSLISGSLIDYSGEADISGKIIGSMDIAAKEVRFFGYAGNSTIDSEILFLDSSSVINGSMTYSANDISSSGTVIGKKHFSGNKKEEYTFLSFIFDYLYDYVSFFLVGILIIFLPWVTIEPRVLKIQKSFMRCLLYGIFVFLAIPVSLVLCAVTVVGIPLAIMGLGFYLGLLYTCKIFFCIYIGSFLRWNRIYQLAFGLGIYTLLIQIPYLGVVISFMAIFVSLGSIVITLQYKKFLKKL
jgi:cytoskeletal protein CcmA (bactofilin family)